MTATATYLYAVARPTPALDRAVRRGIGGAAVRVLNLDGLCCVVSDVDLAEFGAEPLRHNLENLDWLERVAREHDAVVHEVAAMTAAVPLRLGTICTDDDSARARIAELRVPALATLEAVTGRQEWGVKVYAVPQRAVAAATGARPASGAEYLRRRRAELDRQTVDASAAADDAESVFDHLRSHAVSARRHRLQDPALSGARHPMLLNAAFLVDEHRAGEFRAEVDRLAGERPDGALVLTGPWPAYSFAALDDA